MQGVSQLVPRRRWDWTKTASCIGQVLQAGLRSFSMQATAGQCAAPNTLAIALVSLKVWECLRVSQQQHSPCDLRLVSVDPRCSGPRVSVMAPMPDLCSGVEQLVSHLWEDVRGNTCGKCVQGQAMTA